MAFTWANTFVAANAVSGMSSGDQTAIDEWPWTSDVCYIQNTSLGTGTVTFTFDMSAGPGDKKGFWVWFRSHVDNANGYSITETRLTDGTSTLWTDSSPGITVTETTFATSEIRVFRIPDSAMSTDPTISGLVLEFDVANLNAGNNRFRFSGMRMSKSPFTAAQETDVPSSLSGADFSCYIASDLGVLGAADAEAVVVWPDSSGNGRHLIRKTGTTSLYEDDTIDYVSFPSGGGSIFFGHWGTRVTGNHIWHTYIYPEDTTTTQGVWSYNSSFAGVVDPATDPNDKNILGIDDEGSGDKFLLMSGDGSAGAHKYGATTVTFEAWVRVTEWIQDSGNEHLWLNDDASPDVDAASGSNNMLTVTVGNRESEDRPFQGRMAEFWWIDGGSFTETNIDDARDVWVNGAATTATPAAVAVTAGIPSVTVTASVEKTATAVPAVGAVPSASVVASVEQTATTVPAAAAVPSASLTASVEKQVSSVAAPAAVPTVTVTASVEHGATTVTVVGGVPLPTVTGSGNATATPSTVPTVAGVPLPGLSASAEPSVSAVPTTVTVPAASVSASVEQVVAAVNTSAGVPTATLSASVEKLLTAVAAVAGVPLATAAASVTIVYQEGGLTATIQLGGLSGSENSSGTTVSVLSGHLTAGSQE